MKSLPSRPATGNLARKASSPSRTPAWPPLGSVKLCSRRVTALRHAWCLSSRGTPETHAGVGGLALRPTMPSAVLSGWTHPASTGVGGSLACCPGAALRRRPPCIVVVLARTVWLSAKLFHCELHNRSVGLNQLLQKGVACAFASALRVLSLVC